MPGESVIVKEQILIAVFSVTEVQGKFLKNNRCIVSGVPIVVRTAESWRYHP